MTAPTDATPPPERTTVLVVDDEDGIRQALTRFLTRLGYNVQAAANASEALAKQAEHHPQAMLCDIRMPETSGVELLPKVLAQDADLAVLMLTGIAERGAGGGAEAPARGSLGFPGFGLFLARFAARHPAERADQADERAAVRAGIALRRTLFIPAGAAHHPVVFFQLRLFHGYQYIASRFREDDP